MKSDPAPSTRARDSSLFRLAEASYSCNHLQVKIRKWTKSPNIWKADSGLLLDSKGVLGFHKLIHKREHRKWVFDVYNMVDDQKVLTKKWVLSNSRLVS